MSDFIRGCAWDGVAGVPYPRADPLDSVRLAGDTWGTARTPVGVRIEFEGDAPVVAIEYRTAIEDAGLRGGGGNTFECWSAGEPVACAPAVLGEGVVELATGPPGRRVVYLPEGMHPTIVGVTGVGGSIQAPLPQRRWLAYGDSIAEGWVAGAPSAAWPAVAGRALALDVVNCGYAGAARGEIASAEQLAMIQADVITVTHGTNCWTRTPHSAAMVAAGTAAFLDILRQGHAHTPIVVVSPVVRPDAETTNNRLGASLTDLRAAIEDAARGREGVTLVPGRDLLDAALLVDGIHPGREGHRVLAEAIGGAVASVV